MVGFWGWSCAGPGLDGLDDPFGPLPAQHILWWKILILWQTSCCYSCHRNTCHRTVHRHLMTLPSQPPSSLFLWIAPKLVLPVLASPLAGCQQGAVAGSRAEARGLVCENTCLFHIRGLVASVVKPCAPGFGCGLLSVSWTCGQGRKLHSHCWYTFESLLMGQDFVSQHFRWW